MKPQLKLATLALLLTTLNPPISSALAATTIDATNKYAYGANLGWIDWRGDTNNGAVIGEYVCSGSMYSANVGWISLGSGSPVNQIQYQNASAADFGVNHDGLGNLRGYAYGANIGWINFENTGAPKVDLWTGKLSGYVYSANCGWISLSNAVAHVQTTTIRPGADTDGDGLTDAWELSYTNNLAGLDAGGDSDGDGMSNFNEYLAGTNPNDPNDVLKITDFLRTPATDYTKLWWNSVPTRFYAVQTNANLVNSFGWADFANPSVPGVGVAGFYDYTTTNSFYRIRAYRPLMP